MSGFQIPVLCLAAAVARNGVIGREGKLPWRIPADMKNFRNLTGSYPAIMGRKTFDSLPGFLPGRMHIVVTSAKETLPPGAFGAASPEEALEIARATSPYRIWIIGGAGVYAHFLPLASQIDITHVDADIDGDTAFPAFDPAPYESQELGGGNAEQPDGTVLPYRFVRYLKKD